VDIAMAQSFARRNDRAVATSTFQPQLFERAVRQIPVRQSVGLTATSYRRDFRADL
jgi:hypothetical protein